MAKDFTFAMGDVAQAHRGRNARTHPCPRATKQEEVRLLAEAIADLHNVAGLIVENRHELIPGESNNRKWKRLCSFQAMSLGNSAPEKLEENQLTGDSGNANGQCWPACRIVFSCTGTPTLAPTRRGSNGVTDSMARTTRSPCVTGKPGVAKFLRERTFKRMRRFVAAF